jgi:hypothetical protein
MARGGHGLAKVSPGPARPYPSTPCGPLLLSFGHLTPYVPGHRCLLPFKNSGTELEYLGEVYSLVAESHDQADYNNK